MLLCKISLKSLALLKLFAHQVWMMVGTARALEVVGIFPIILAGSDIYI